MSISINNKLEIISFTVDNDDSIYAVELEQVREVVDLEKLTTVPGAAPHLPGLINHRGKILPTYDLGCKICGKKTLINKNTSIIVCEFSSIFPPLSVGFIIGEAHFIFSVNRSQLNPPPPISYMRDNSAVKGIILDQNREIILLDLNALLVEDNIIDAEEYTYDQQENQVEEYSSCG